VRERLGLLVFQEAPNDTVNAQSPASDRAQHRPKYKQSGQKKPEALWLRGFASEVPVQLIPARDTFWRAA